MPGMDGTGPRGQGPMTGGGRGRCGNQTDLGSRSLYGKWNFYFNIFKLAVPFIARLGFSAYGSFRNTDSKKSLGNGAKKSLGNGSIK